MTIEIKELVIQACVSDLPSKKSMTRTKYEEHRLLEMIRKQVKEEVRDMYRREKWQL